MNRKFRISQDGVVGIVVAVLLLGLMVSVVSLVQLVYVPDWMEQREAEHMDEVATQFSQLKFAIDTLNANKQNYTTIATSITLGSKELPYWMSLRAFGNLEILSDEFKITIINVSSSSNFSIGGIKYSSSNGYFLDQDFIYEGGAIITNQADGNIISIKPSFPGIKKVGNKLFLTLNLINISGVGGKLSGSGYGTTAIQTEYSGLQIEQIIEDVRSIEIFSKYSYSWYIFMNWTLENQGLVPGAVVGDFYITPDHDNNRITVDFFSTNLEGFPTINLSIIEILAQIGPGWID
jgi:hypothetical protein